MARERFFLFALNGGVVSPRSLARTDLARMRLTAETMDNIFPKVIGPMSLRPGMKYEGKTKSTAAARQIPFIFSATDTAKIELTDSVARFIADGAPIERVAVSTTITNGDFSSSTGWNLVATTGGVSDINSTVANNLYLFADTRGSEVAAWRKFTVAEADRGKEHAVRIKVDRGSVFVRMGDTLPDLLGIPQRNNGQTYLAEAKYGEGVSEIAFTPPAGSGDLEIEIDISTDEFTPVHVDSVLIAGSGIVEMDTVWTASDLANVRYDQSGDVIYVVDGAHCPYRIERRGSNRSWAIVKYKFVDGPFIGKTSNIELTASGRINTGTLTASADFFKDGHVGALFELTHARTVRSRNLAGKDVYTEELRVAGLKSGNVRKITYDVSGTWVGTLNLQLSFDSGDNWQNHTSLTANPGAPVTLEPGTDNSIVNVRMGFQSEDYTSGEANITLNQPAGGGAGVVRITTVTDPTHADYEVITPLHQDQVTKYWQEGKYSDLRGWPTAVVLFDGRLWFGGNDQLAGSYSDDFTNFNVNEDGDAAPIIRSIATGPVNKVQWLLGLSRLVIGTSGAESVARSTSFDEPMTPSNFSIKDASSYGSADVQAVKVDKSGVFIHRSGKRAFDLTYSIEAQDYSSNEITRYSPDILAAGVVRIAVQRQPDTRIWFVMEDGTAAVVVYERGEDVISWCTFSTDGVIEDCIVLPNTQGDDVHFIVKRTIDGVDVRYREVLSYEQNTVGGDDNYLSDSFIVTSIVSTNVISGLNHLEGKDVVVWIHGEPLLDADSNPAFFKVSGGQITIPSATSGTAVVGLYYEGFWKSTKLAYASQTGTAMSQRKILSAVAPILYKTHPKACLFGQDFTTMDPLPDILDGAATPTGTVLDDYDRDSFTLPGSWSTDSRMCVRMRAPLPATVLGIGMLMDSHEQS